MPRTKRGGKEFRRRKERVKRTKEEWEEMKKQNPKLGKGYKLAPKSNNLFEKFYKGIGIVPEEEWDAFLSTMKKPLPTTFRITGSRNQAQELLKIIKGQYFNKFISKDYEGTRLDPKSLPWYPDEMAWQLDFTKKEIRQDNTLKSLHGFLVSETESGNISRQEAVSMLPPLLMDIEQYHKILDMCAAPGSKTAQLIEMLHQDDSVPVPEGFVVANDMDNKRCYLMTHQVKRIQSPNCMIINHDARILPNMVTSLEEKAEFIKYDRILCDVPCSGDGTMRKNPDIWQKWHINGGYNLHKIQKKVLQRGLELLAVGGRLVYSTCSLNPVENEAVILTILKQCDGAVELVDVSDRLTGLKYCKGTYSWKCMTKDGVWYETYDQASEQFRDNWDSTIYPPIITEAQDAKLERCIRVLPHQQNTGAFFIAVLTKSKELPWLKDRAYGRTDPIINPKLKLDEAERKQQDSQYISFGVRCGSGLYKYAKCNLCNIMLQGKNDYTSHISGRRHKTNVEKHLESDRNQQPVAMETDSASTSDTSNGQSTDAGPSTAGAQEGGTEVTPGDNTKVEDQGTAEDSSKDGPPPAKKSRREKQMERINKGELKVVMQGHREDPFYFCAPDDPVWPGIKKFFDITDGMNQEQLMFRNMKRVLYYVSKPVRQLVLCNDERVKFINLGVKCFSNAPSPLVPDCDFRLSQEGLLAIEPFLRGRRIYMKRQDIVTILSEENPFICKLSPTAQENAHSLTPGSSLFIFKPTESDPEPNVEIVFCGWRGKTSVRSFVGKDERSHYLRLCGVELTDIQERVREAKAAKQTVSSVTDGTATPIGPQSGDEEELNQWNQGQESPRGLEEDDIDSEENREQGELAGQGSRAETDHKAREPCQNTEPGSEGKVETDTQGVNETG